MTEGIKISLLALLVLVGCMRTPLSGPENAFRLSAVPFIKDDLPTEPLIEALEAQIAVLSKKDPDQQIVFGERVTNNSEYLKGLKFFIEIAKNTPNKDKLRERLADSFDFYEVYGDKSWGDVLITSYFEPVIRGSTVKTEMFSRAMYRTPSDIFNLSLSKFDSKFDNERALRARISDKHILPYYSREEIDSQQKLAGQNLEICYVDPVDAFFFHIQGSGTVILEDGKHLRLNYGEKNGQRYEAVGKFLKEKFAPEPVTMQRIESYLRSITPEEAQAFMNKNPSYVFFRELDRNAVTYSGLPATAGRTIATDKRFFPKGALALLVFDKPDLDNNTKQTVGRFVIDQDIGGAIGGGGRVDLFWGQGDEAKRYAGIINTRGKLYYIVPKPVYHAMVAR